MRNVRNVVFFLVLAVALTLIALVLIGTQVSGRLGGPCSYPDASPRPSFCTSPD